ncbi:hypothetical protein SAMN05428944_0963 [Streptomyces sp. 1222.5]|uniref:DUF6545 domain-containing protein n=1 Tax=unclassified Streptomyces TaxID=2593676 RepID=UPI000899A46C|nr:MULTISPECIES: DUF6545 domain-containing protein [unclassified Streptomyces]PKW11807.1 hypothetical protein BX260_7130 [Streptomyces sp. 5112.2]SEB69570.1 hypothetical protein SAMN05428944_0963 [Streptomyces sp. 1222.5]
MSYVVYLAAAILGMAAVLLFRRPRQALTNPLTASTCVSILIGACCFSAAAPATLATVNRMTGITNFGAPMTYSLISAYSCSLFILLIYWRGGPVVTLRRTALAFIGVYGLLIAAIITLFTVGDAHVERLRDLDTYYANTPYIREMIVLYLLGHLVCCLVICGVCLRWTRQLRQETTSSAAADGAGPGAPAASKGDRLLRAGLWLIVIGLGMDMSGFVLAKIIAVTARWYGRDLDFLSTTVAPPLASVGAVICSLGFVLPRIVPAVGAQWRSLRHYRRLAPLWKVLRHVPTAFVSPSTWYRLPQSRLRMREMAIHDALLVLTPHLDERAGSGVLRRALAAGCDPTAARAKAEASMVVEAARQLARGAADSLTEPGTYELRTSKDASRGLLRLAQELNTPGTVIGVDPLAAPTHGTRNGS